MTHEIIHFTSLSYHRRIWELADYRFIILLLVRRIYMNDSLIFNECHAESR